MHCTKCTNLFFVLLLKNKDETRHKVAESETMTCTENKEIHKNLHVNTKQINP